MRRVLIYLVLIAASMTATSFAQEAPSAKVDLFGGYSTQGGNGRGGIVNGWNAALGWNLHRNVSLVADFSGAYDVYDSSLFSIAVRRHTFLFGPQVATSFKRFRPFAHALAGADHFGVDLAGSGLGDTGWAMALGGGIDVHAYKNLSLRLAQIDYLRSHHAGNGLNDGRYSAGIVLHLGRNK